MYMYIRLCMCINMHTHRLCYPGNRIEYTCRYWKITLLRRMKKSFGIKDYSLYNLFLPCYTFDWLSLHGLFFVFVFPISSSCFSYSSRKIQWNIFKQSWVLPGTFDLFRFNILMEILGFGSTFFYIFPHTLSFFLVFHVFSCMHFKKIIQHFILFLWLLYT